MLTSEPLRMRVKNENQFQCLTARWAYRVAFCFYIRILRSFNNAIMQWMQSRSPDVGIIQVPKLDSKSIWVRVRARNESVFILRNKFLLVNELWIVLYFSIINKSFHALPCSKFFAAALISRSKCLKQVRDQGSH